MMRRSDIKLRKEQLLANLDHVAESFKSHRFSRFNEIHPVFILSTGRTGTHFFSHFFNKNFQDVFAVHEPPKDTYDLNINFVKGSLSLSQAVLVFKYFRKGVLGDAISGNNSFYVESNNNLSFLIPVIKKVFPQAKFIHITRDGKDVVRSIYSRQTRKGDGFADIYSHDDPRNRLKSNFFHDDPYSDEWQQMSRFQKICWYWAKKDSLIHDGLKEDPMARTFKFEELFKNPDLNKWEELVSFTGLDKNMDPGFDILKYIASSRSNKTKSFRLGNWETWPEEFKSDFRNFAAYHMKVCGYKV